jgi:hypothetical protein
VGVSEWFGKLEVAGFGRHGGVRYVAFSPSAPVDIVVPQLDHPPTRIIDLFVPYSEESMSVARSRVKQEGA